MSVIAILVGGWWAYDNFIKERKHLPHANIEHIISHIPITRSTNLLTVAVVVTNTGTSNLQIKDSETRIQQILPSRCISPDQCPTTEMTEALENVNRKKDRFSWLMIAQRRESKTVPLIVEPGEKEQIDLEFALPRVVKVIRVYSFIANPNLSGLGWHMSTYHQLDESIRIKGEAK